MRPIVWKSSSRARSLGRRWPRSFPPATSARSMACREAPVEYWVSIWMSVTSTPFGPNYLRSKGMPCRWPERDRFAPARLPDGGPGRARRRSSRLSEASPAWEHQRRGRSRVGGTHERDHRVAIGGTQQRGNGGRVGRAHQRGNGARGGPAHQRADAAVVGGTHEWDRCTSLVGSVKREPGRGDLRDLGFELHRLHDILRERMGSSKLLSCN